jgi:hypothetical protein
MVPTNSPAKLLAAKQAWSESPKRPVLSAEKNQAWRDIGGHEQVIKLEAATERKEKHKHPDVARCREAVKTRQNLRCPRVNHATLQANDSAYQQSSTANQSCCDVLRISEGLRCALVPVIGLACEVGGKFRDVCQGLKRPN